MWFKILNSYSTTYNSSTSHSTISTRFLLRYLLEVVIPLTKLLINFWHKSRVIIKAREVEKKLREWAKYKHFDKPFHSSLTHYLYPFIESSFNFHSFFSRIILVNYSSFKSIVVSLTIALLTTLGDYIYHQSTDLVETSRIQPL